MNTVRMAWALVVLTLCVSAPQVSQATTFTWNFNVPGGAIASPHSYLDLSSSYTLTAYGYTTQFSSPTAASIGDLWFAGAVTSNDLYGKTSSPDETGLGLNGPTPDHEIDAHSFVQLDLSDLISNNFTGLILIVSSIQAGEGFYLWGSNMLGVPGVLLYQGRNPQTGGDVQSIPVPQFGQYTYIAVSGTPIVPPHTSSDVLIRNGLTAEQPEPPGPIDPADRRQCFLPVTLTQEGWAAFSDPTNPIIKGGMVYNRFPIAFAGFSFFGKAAPNKLIVGGKYTITYTGTTSSLQRLCLLFGQPCGNGDKLTHSLVSPWILTPQDGGGCLAVETIVLLMNVAYNDMRLMPRTPGYDLECFTVAKGPLIGKTVAEVFNIANAVLAGDPPRKYGLPNYATLVGILRQINADYEFVDYQMFFDRGYLIPNRPFGQPGPRHSVAVPMVCKP